MKYGFATLLLSLAAIYQQAQAKAVPFLDVGTQVTVSCAVTHFILDLGETLEVQPRLIPTTLADASASMAEGHFDISAHGISSTNSAAPENALPSDPYLAVKRGFTVLKKSPYARMKRLPSGTRVAVMENSTAYQDIIKNYPPEHFELVIISQLEGSPRARLRRGEIAAIAEGYTGFWFSSADAKDLTMIDIHPLDNDKPNAEGLVFWVREDKPELLEAINQQLAELTDNVYLHYQDNNTCNTNYRKAR